MSIFINFYFPFVVTFYFVLKNENLEAKSTFSFNNNIVICMFIYERKCYLQEFSSNEIYRRFSQSNNSKFIEKELKILSQPILYVQ